MSEPTWDDIEWTAVQVARLLSEREREPGVLAWNVALRDRLSEMAGHLAALGVPCPCTDGFSAAPLVSALVHALNHEWCPSAPDGERGHCMHWYDCEPCHRCGWDGGGDGCDCPRHNPGLYDEHGELLPEGTPDDR